MSDKEIQRYVEDELVYDPKVDSAAVAVSAHGGDVTLRGTVGSFRQKLEAKKAAERVYGVKGVDNQLQVRLLGDNGKEAADLRGAVLKALTLNTFVPSTVDANVTDGTVTLTGAVDWQYQRDEAEWVAGSVPGVTDVFDEIDLVGEKPDAGDVKHAIKDAFKRDAKLDAETLSVSTYDGTVTLDGTVSSWAEHDAAIDAAWAAPGVTDVEDRILVDY
jgi:osmotically-inducible protein OsmY